MKSLRRYTLRPVMVKIVSKKKKKDLTKDNNTQYVYIKSLC